MRVALIRGMAPVSAHSVRTATRPRARVVLLAIAVLITGELAATGCAPVRRESVTAAHAGRGVKRRAVRYRGADQERLPWARKLTIVKVRVPDGAGLPPIFGQLQHYEVGGNESLLTIARRTGVGFRELRDANPTIDEWEPRIGSDLLVPTRWILPQVDEYRGLVINIPEMRLYMFPVDTFPGERVPVLTWPIGIGAEEAPSPVGPFTVVSKDENPTWVVPDSILRTMDHPQRVVPPGPDNPLGAYRIRLSKDLYAIHGTNDPWTVGRLTTHGCIRLYPEDIEMLYPLVGRGTPGELVYQPVKIGERDGDVYVEIHQDVYQMYPDLEGYALGEVARAGVERRVDPMLVRAAARAKLGIPVNVTRRPPHRLTTATEDEQRSGEPHARRDAAPPSAPTLSSRATRAVGPRGYR